MFTTSITCFFRSQSVADCVHYHLLLSVTITLFSWLQSVGDCVHYHLFLSVTISCRLCSLLPSSLGHSQLATVFTITFFSFGHNQLQTVFIIIVCFFRPQSVADVGYITFFSWSQLQTVFAITFFRSHSVADIGCLGVKHQVTYLLTIADCVQQSTASFVH